MEQASPGIGRLAAAGAAAGLWYGAVETLVIGLLWPLSPLSPDRAAPLWITAALLGLYAVAGALLGLTALPLRRRLRSDAPAVAATAVGTFWLAVAYGAHVALDVPSSLQKMMFVAVALALAGLAAWTAVRPSAPPLLRAMTHPAWASLALIGLPWLLRRAFLGPGRVGLLALSGLGLGGLVAAAWVAGIASRGRPRSPSLPRALLAAAVALAVTVWVAGDAPSLPQRGAAVEPGDAALNVVLVTLDTVRADHLSLDGYWRDTTPYLQRRAADSLVFEQAYSASNLTLPSHASLFTGRYTTEHGAHFATDRILGQALPERFDTLAERLQRAGYATYSVVANYPMLGRSHGLDQGFEYLDARGPRTVGARTEREMLRAGVIARLRERLGRVGAAAYRDASEIRAGAVEVLRHAAQDERPFLLFVNFMDTHFPYLPKPPYDARYGKHEPYLDAAGYRALRSGLLAGTRAITEEERQGLVSRYDGALAYVDAELERVLHTVSDLGLAERTLIVVTSDHGEALGDHELVNHGVSLFQDQVHVPLLIEAPGLPARVDTTPLSQIDLLRTILDLAGVGADPETHGQDVAGDGTDRSPVVVEAFPESWIGQLDAERGLRERAWIAGRLKLLRREDGAVRLFDVIADPAEQHDLSAQDPDAAALVRALAAWVAATPQAEGDAPEVDRRTLDAMRSLGYVE